MRYKPVPYLAFHIVSFTFPHRVINPPDYPVQTFRSKVRDLFRIRRQCKAIKKGAKR